MSQQLNLIDASQSPRRDAFGAGSGLAIVALVLLGSAAAAVALQWQADAAMAAVAAPAPVAAAAPAAPASSPAALEAELQRLVAVERRQQQLGAALSADTGGAPDGYTPYLRALARQSNASLWITAFAVGAEGDAIEIEGRMTDASALPGYLRRLNAEQRFVGRPFAQLQLRTVDAGAASVTEFALRSAPASREAAR